MKDKIEVYSKIIEWLFVSHNAYDSARDWRVSFVKFLKEVLEIK